MGARKRSPSDAFDAELPFRTMADAQEQVTRQEWEGPSAIVRFVALEGRTHVLETRGRETGLCMLDISQLRYELPRAV